MTAAATGGGDTDYRNTISLDQFYADAVGEQTRFASLVMSTDGGTGTARGAHTLSFDRNGRAIPAENRPKRIFDMLFVKSDQNAARRLALSNSALDDLLNDARRLRADLPVTDRRSLDEYLDSVREAEKKVEKTKRWVNTPLPQVDADHLKLEVGPDEPRRYVQTMLGTGHGSATTSAQLRLHSKSRRAGRGAVLWWLSWMSGLVWWSSQLGISSGRSPAAADRSPNSCSDSMGKNRKARRPRGAWKYIDTPDGDRFLFHLGDDLGEEQNVIDKHPELASRLRKMLDEWEEDVDPPLYDQRAQAYQNKNK